MTRKPLVNGDLRCKYARRVRHSMPTVKLIQLAVNRLDPPPAGNVTYWDGQLPGFGVLISSRGRRTWVAMYRVSGKPVIETLGTMAVIPKVEVARDLARASIAGFARVVIDCQWPSIGRVAEVLARRRRLSYLECGRLAR
jgi:hypothetical protein